MKKICTLFVTVFVLQGLLKIGAKAVPGNTANVLSYDGEKRDKENSQSNDVYAEDLEDESNLADEDTSDKDYSAEEENESDNDQQNSQSNDVYADDSEDESNLAYEEDYSAEEENESDKDQQNFQSKEDLEDESDETDKEEEQNESDNNQKNSQSNDVYTEDLEDESDETDEKDISDKIYSTQKENEASEENETNYEEDEPNSEEEELGEDLHPDASEKGQKRIKKSYKEFSAEDSEVDKPSKTSQEDDSTDAPEKSNPERLPEQLTGNEVVQPITKKSPINSSQFSDEIMQTADTMVFRPFFRYRKQSVEKKKIYKDKLGNVYSKPDKSPHKPDDNIPPVLVYDKETGGYHPQYRYYSNPYQFFNRHG